MAKKKLSPDHATEDVAPKQERSGGGGARPAARLRFVVQRHAATRLHYNLRLELDGVFKSWALARGPSRDPHDKRLAAEVEDHPLEYGDFEGVIPAGQYGGGAVQLWDRGYWSPEGMTAEDGLSAGDLKFTLEGERLHGSWVLVRMQRDWAGLTGRGRRANWLLIKHRDAHAKEGDDDALLTNDRSVASGRSMAKIAAGEGRAPKPFMAVSGAAPPANDAVWDTRTGIAADQRSAARSERANPAAEATKTGKTSSGREAATRPAAKAQPGGPERQKTGNIVVAKAPSRRR